MNKLDALIAEKQKELRGLGVVPWLGFRNPLTLLLRRRESYLLGELRGLITAKDALSNKV